MTTMQEKIELIQKFLLGEMGPEEKAAFKQRVENDKQLQQLMSQQITIYESIKNAHLN